MIGLLLDQFLPYIVGAVALIGAMWGYGRKKKKDGRRELAEEIVREDAKNADTMEEAVDEVLDRERPRNAIDRLRDQGRLRGED